MTESDPFVTELTARLEGDPRVLGLVLAGSSADTSRRDRWSDHDFLVVTQDGTPEWFRTDLSWLPDSEDIGFWFRETPHGLKVLYRSGLLLEFAVFDRSEFATCALNHHAVVLDRSDIAAMAAEIHARTATPPTVDRLVALRTFLSLVLIGTGRARRGERLSANVLLRDYATAPLLRLVADLLPEADRAPLDALDPWRRFERAAPAFAAAIDAALSGPVVDTGPALVVAADSFLREHWDDYPADETALVLRLLAESGPDVSARS